MVAQERRQCNCPVLLLEAIFDLARVEQLLLNPRHSRIRASSPIWALHWLGVSPGEYS